MMIIPAPFPGSSKNCEDDISFLGISHKEHKEMNAAQKEISNRNYPRPELVNILREYNTLIGNDALALQNVERLISVEQGCVVTGQQLGLMGGPAYTILKGISCLLQARSLNAVPIFWLATEDHDVAEIDHTYLLDAYGNLKKFHLSFPKDGRCVEDLQLSDHNIEIIQQFLHTASIDKARWPKINSSYALTMAQMMVQLFAGTGMVFVEPKLLRPLAKPFFQREIEESVHFQTILKKTTEELVAAGGKEVISFNAGTNLFLKDKEGRRQKITFNDAVFQSGKQTFSKQDVLSLINEQPERFSTNVAARPVLQSLLIPTIAYVGGPTEIEYFRQLVDYHRAHGIPMPTIIQRISATFIPQHANEILVQCDLYPEKTIPSHWRDVFPLIQVESTHLAEEWKQSALKCFEEEISSEVVERIVKSSINKLQKRVVKKRLQAKHIPSHGLHLLRNLIHPHHKLQERVLNWWNFQAKSQENFVQEFLKLPFIMPNKHFYCYC